MVDVEFVNRYIEKEINSWISLRKKYEKEIMELEEGLDIKNYVNGRVWDAVWDAKRNKEKSVHRIDNTTKRLSRLKKIDNLEDKHSSIMHLHETKQREETYVLDFYYWTQSLLKCDKKHRKGD